MLDWWWAPVAFMLGGTLGVLIVALCVSARDGRR